MIDRVESAAINTKPVIHLMPAVRRLLGPLTIAWLLLVPVLAMRAPGPPLETVQTVLQVHPERWESLVFALLCLGAAVVLTVVAGVLSPARWRRAMLALAVVPALALLVTSGNLLAGLTVIAIIALWLWFGRQLAATLLGIGDTADAWTIGSGLGLLALAVLGVVLLATGAFHAAVIWGFVLALAIALFWTSRARLRNVVATWTHWLQQPSMLRPEDLVAVGLILGTYWLALIGVLAPEVMSDAVRQRLPAAALFAREGHFAVDPYLYLTPQPRLGEVLYAIVLACGPLETTKILNFVVGLLCSLAVWNLGRHLGGAKAALLALLAFATLPLAAFLAQVAYVDLFATLFGLTAAMIVVVRDRFSIAAFLAAAACLLAGFAVKDSAIFVAFGLGLSLVLVLLDSISPMIGRFAIVASLVGLLVGTLWLTQTYDGLRAIPGLAPVVATLDTAHGLYEGHVPAMGFGGPHALVDLVHVPIDLVISTPRYGEYSAGFVGYILVPMALLVLFLPASRRSRMLLVGVAVALVAWFAFTQYVRYALPMLAILAAFGAAAYVSIMQRSGPTTRLALAILPPALAALGLLGYLNTVLLSPGVVPFRVALGQESKTAYLTDHVGGYTALRLLNAEPNVSRVATSNEFAQIYTSASLNDVLYFSALRDGINDEASVLQFLDTSGYSHILLDRDAFRTGWDQIVAFDESFLRRNTVLVGGDQNAYLYRLVPANERGHDQVWAQGPELLPDGGFEQGAGSVPRGWDSTGKVKRVTSGRGYQTPASAVRIAPGSALSATVRVTPGTQYLLSQASKGVGAAGAMRMQITWLSQGKAEMGSVVEVVPTSELDYHRFSMLATAPPDARWATVELQPTSSEALIDDVSLRSREG